MKWKLFWANIVPTLVMEDIQRRHGRMAPKGSSLRDRPLCGLMANKEQVRTWLYNFPPPFYNLLHSSCLNTVWASASVTWNRDMTCEESWGLENPRWPIWFPWPEVLHHRFKTPEYLKQVALPTKCCYVEWSCSGFQDIPFFLFPSFLCFSSQQIISIPWQLNMFSSHWTV